MLKALIQQYAKGQHSAGTATRSERSPVFDEPQVLASPLYHSFLQGDAMHVVEKLCDTTNVRLVCPRPPKNLKKLIHRHWKCKPGFASLEDMLRCRHEAAFKMWKPIVEATNCNLRDMLN